MTTTKRTPEQRRADRLAARERLTVRRNEARAAGFRRLSRYHAALRQGPAALEGRTPVALLRTGRRG